MPLTVPTPMVRLTPLVLVQLSVAQPMPLWLCRHRSAQQISDTGLQTQVCTGIQTQVCRRRSAQDFRHRSAQQISSAALHLLRAS